MLTKAEGASRDRPSAFLTAVSPTLYLVVLRVLMGYILLATAIENAGKGLYGPGFQTFVAGWANGNPLGWYRSFLETVVIPNWQTVALVQSIAEPALGIALLVGLFTPVASLGGAFFFANLLLASLGKEWPWTYVNMIVMLLVVGASGSGRCLGLDYFVARRFHGLGVLIKGISGRAAPGRRDAESL
jgi:thiosulfate dehydrogenase (quinone) large subunit